MTTIAVAPVVEGHGEIAAVPILVRRIFSELYAQTNVEVLRPIRVPRTKLIKPPDLARAVSLADLKLRNVVAHRRLVLIVFDADEDSACQLAPMLLDKVQGDRPDVDVALVLAVPEYETWFVAAAQSLTQYLAVPPLDVPLNPELARAKKGWVQSHFRGRYTETIEQPALTARMDLRMCRSRAASFDKLCRELEKRTL